MKTLSTVFVTLNNTITYISNLKGWMPIFDLDLFNCYNTTECYVMFVFVVPKDIFQNGPRSQTAIDSLMTGSCTVHELIVFYRPCIHWCHSSTVTPVAFVSNDFFSRTEHILQFVPKDQDITPSSTLKWPSVRHNVSSVDTYANFVPNAGPTKLV